MCIRIFSTFFSFFLFTHNRHKVENSLLSNAILVYRYYTQHIIIIITDHYYNAHDCSMNKFYFSFFFWTIFSYFSSLLSLNYITFEKEHLFCIYIYICIQGCSVTNYTSEQGMILHEKLSQECKIKFWYLMQIFNATRFLIAFAYSTFST